MIIYVNKPFLEGFKIDQSLIQPIPKIAADQLGG